MDSGNVTAVPAVKASSTSDFSNAETSAKKSSRPRLLQELIDLIIDLLGDDIRSLRACAMTCFSWLPRSRSHLHRIVKLSSEARCRHAAWVYDSPALAQHVRELRIIDCEHRDTEGRDLSWVGNHASRVIQKLSQTSLESLLIQNIQNMQWATIQPTPGACMLPTVTTLTLKRVEFDTAKDFTLFLSHFPQLSTLVVKDLTFVHRGGNPSVAGPRPRLHTLEILSGSCQEFLLNWYLNQPAQGLALRSLAYSIDKWRVNAPIQSLQAIGSSVQHLTLVFAYESPHYLLRGDPLLPYFTSIRSLTFDHATLYGSLYGSPSIPALLHHVNSVEVSAIRFRFALEDNYITLDDNVDKVSRIKLEQTGCKLHSLPAFSALKEVVIEIRSSQWSKLAKLGTASRWVRSGLEEKPHRLFKEPESDWIQTDFEKTQETWERAQAVLERELAWFNERHLLTIRPVDPDRPEPILGLRHQSSWGFLHWSYGPDT
ncbi:hypothetical protein AcW1_001602 [Taiwanofungus camphoratus]|nr:hypothetical protein AcW1_001602 [Antrodia cinnamomea]